MKLIKIKMEMVISEEVEKIDEKLIKNLINQSYSWTIRVNV